MRLERCVICQEMKSWCGMNGYGQCRECAEKVEASNRARSGLTSDYGPEAEQALDEVCASFPATFGLRAHEGTFRVNRRNSFVSRGVIYIYTDVQRDGKWVDFAKGTPEELRGQIRR